MGEEREERWEGKRREGVGKGRGVDMIITMLQIVIFVQVLLLTAMHALVEEVVPF